MTTSETIATIAIITSSLISIVSLSISYFINKSNIRARRSEIAFEKRIEAFREMMEKIRRFGYVISDHVNVNVENNTKVAEFKSNCLKSIEDLLFTYWKQNVYFTPTVDKSIGELRKLSVDYLNKFGETYDAQIAEEWFSKYTEKQDQVIGLMQEIIGFN